MITIARLEHATVPQANAHLLHWALRVSQLISAPLIHSALYLQHLRPARLLITTNR